MRYYLAESVPDKSVFVNKELYRVDGNTLYVLKRAKQTYWTKAIGGIGDLLFYVQYGKIRELTGSELEIYKNHYKHHMRGKQEF